MIPLPYQGADDNLILHPLAPGACILLSHADGFVPIEPHELRGEFEAIGYRLDRVFAMYERRLDLEGSATAAAPALAGV